MFSGRSSMHYNTTLISTIAATGISCNITSVEFSYWILAKGTGLLCVWFFNMSQESLLFYSLDSKSLQTLLLTSALPTEVLQLRMRFRVARQPRFQVWQQFLSVLQIPQNMKDSVFSSTGFWKSWMSGTLWTWSTSFPPSSQRDRKSFHGRVFFSLFCGFLNFF